MRIWNRPNSISRRGFLQWSSLSALSWCSAQALADVSTSRDHLPARAKAAIILWMYGGPSQLETFDPHPGSVIGGPTRAIKTRVPGVEIAAGLPQVAEQLDKIAVIRSMVGKEVDHDRGAYLMRTSYQPTESVVHPSFGSICAANLPSGDLPPFINFMCSDARSRAGYLGDLYDRLIVGDPQQPPKNMSANVPPERLSERISLLQAFEAQLRQRNSRLGERTLHEQQVNKVLAIARSSETKAFHINEEPAAIRARYGDTPFGRSCLAARRLVEVGVRCVEVQLDTWDSHLFNFDKHAELNATLDPAFAGLLTDLEERDLLKSTLVIWAGEFGRTPKIQALEGRDHWPHGFSVALAGGGIQGGQVIGATDPAGSPKPADPVSIPDLFATLLTLLGINPAAERTIDSRPIKLCEGMAIPRLMTT
jgi:hypothetical protein